MPSFSATPPRKIAFIIYHDVKLLDLSGPLQVFQEANEVAGETLYVPLIGSLNGGSVDCEGGLPMASRPLTGLGLSSNDTLIACGGPGVFEQSRSPRLVRALRQAAEKAGRIGATCTGAFLLASAGLLDGRRAVTHWKRCGELADSHPEIDVDPDPIFIEDGGVWTSAGVTAGIDLALAMVEADHGRELALKTARELLVYVKRPGGQSQYSEELKAQTRNASGRFDALHFWVRSHLGADLRVPALAERCGMSPRHFARLYTDEIGRTPARMIEQYRVEAAREELENGAGSVKEIAARCGFGDPERMRRSFVRLLGVSPQAYRERFAAEPA